MAAECGVVLNKEAVNRSCHWGRKRHSTSIRDVILLIFIGNPIFLQGVNFFLTVQLLSDF